MIINFLFTDRAGIEAQIRVIVATSQMKKGDVMKQRCESEREAAWVEAQIRAFRFIFKRIRW